VTSLMMSCGAASYQMDHEAQECRRLSQLQFTISFLIISYKTNPLHADLACTISLEVLCYSIISPFGRLLSGWRRHDFSKQTMSRAEISEKMLPDCLWLRGYLMDRKRSPEQYQTSGKFKRMRTKFADPLLWTFLAYSWGVGQHM
jgi:hypothetical protein